MPSVSRVVKAGKSPGYFDYYCASLSLPGLLKIKSDNIPGDVPYLFADANKVHWWKSHVAGFPLKSESKMKIGFVWKGRPTHTRDEFRSASIENFLPLLEMANIQWFSIQKDAMAAEVQAMKSAGEKNGDENSVVDMSGGLHSYADTAALLECLDLLITVDTSVAHLAGALGKPVWMLCALVPDHRWLSTGSTTAWYPSMRIFRQTQEYDWHSVIAEVKVQLMRLIATAKS